MSGIQVMAFMANTRFAKMPRAKTAWIAIVAMAPLTALPDPAHAYTSWPDESYEQAEPGAPAAQWPVIRKHFSGSFQRAIIGQKAGHHGSAGHIKTAAAPATSAKPHGPLIIAISIDQQHLRIYDADGLFAESPVSTGMRGHATPMGVFSVIQKSKWHRSNIYSGAPMPYMQRITWSGIALHAGVLPGYPASHGCIRMPLVFAVKLWSWSKLGARVVIAPEDVLPTRISHPALMTEAPAAPPPGLESKITGANASAAGSADSATMPPTGQTVVRADTQLPPAEQAPPQAPTTERVQLANAATAVPTRLPAKSEAAPGQSDAATAAKGPAADPQAVEVAPASPLGGNAAIPQSKAPAAEAATAVVSPKDDAPAQLATPTEPTSNVVKRSGHIAVLISRKDSRLYARQNFEPWFDVPVTISQGDRPLGTHVFTASADTTDPGKFRWSVMSLPPLPRPHDADEGRSRPKRSRQVRESEPQQLPTAAQALDRLTIPEDAAAKIAGALAPGGSIIVSDRGRGDETGLGTDFIVPLR